MIANCSLITFPYTWFAVNHGIENGIDHHMGQRESRIFGNGRDGVEEVREFHLVNLPHVSVVTFGMLAGVGDVGQAVSQLHEGS